MQCSLRFSIDLSFGSVQRSQGGRIDGQEMENTKEWMDVGVKQFVNQALQNLSAKATAMRYTVKSVLLILPICMATEVTILF